MAPPTPPGIDGQELHDGFDQLLQHNIRGQPHPEAYAFDSSSYVPGPPAPFTTPEPEQGGWYVDQFGNKNYLYHDQTNLGAEIPFVSHRMGSKIHSTLTLLEIGHIRPACV